MIASITGLAPEGFGVAAVYTPKHFQLNSIMREIVRLPDDAAEAA